MRKSLITVCMCAGMLAAAMPMEASTVWSSYMSEEPNAAPERSRGVVARMDLPEFSAIYCDVVANITIEQGNEFLIEARGPEHLVRLIEPEVSKNGTLTVKSTKEYKVKKDNGISIRIVTPTIDMVYNDCVGNIHLKGTVKAEMMTVTNEGVGNITFDNLQCEILQVINDGVGNIEFTGKVTERAVFKSDGVGNINAYNLETPDLTADLNGVGGIECYVTQRFTCSANGVGSIYYKGDPKQTNIRNNGIGKVRRR